MPLDAAEGGITLAEQYFAAQLAACARFQAWCNVDTAERALLRIHFDSLPPPSNDDGVFSKDELVSYRPFALVWTDENGGYKRTRVGTGCYAESGTIGVQLEQAVADSEASDPAQALRQFKNTLGVIISELEALAYEAGYLAFNEIHMTGPWREDIKSIPQQGDHLFAFLTVQWGAE